MSKIDKLIEKLLKGQSDFTWRELVKVLNHFEFKEVRSKGKTAGSRRKFINENREIINLHEPHPNPKVKEYVLKQVIQKLKLKKK
ncbi:MAG TPA: type II toxin-antitoxin system HicA family toxin [Salinimicrobium sp.]|nr:type II toxin-antitoxin system HicA family toxin [Salinimicrobium sp.]